MAYLELAVLAVVGFLIVASRWLLVLRSHAKAAKLPLTALDKVLAAAPVAYAVFCMLAAGRLLDYSVAILGASDPVVTIPLAGATERGRALWFIGLLAGLAITSPIVVIFTVEAYFGRKLPELVRLGRRAVFAVLTGVKVPAPKDDDEWKGLLGR